MKFLVLFIFLFSLSAIALDIPKETTYKINDEKYFWLFDESNKWVLNTVEFKKDQLADITNVQYFDSEKAALHEIQKITGAVKSAPLETLRNLPSVSTEVRNQSLWKVENEWSWEWEKKYAEWITENKALDFFLKHNIATDCADSVMAYRWIFARIHKLPVAQQTTVSKELITQDTMKKAWLSVPTHEDWEKDQRFFKALDYVQLVTYTKTLYKDGYALDLIRDAFIPGFHYVGNGHSMVSIGIIDNKHMMFNSSTMPREVRELFPMDYFTDELYTEATGGLMRMKWPYKKEGKWVLTDKKKMPYYGTGQYSKDLLNNEFESAKIGIYLKLGMEFTKFDLFKTSIESGFMQLYNRVETVLDGIEVCRKQDCSPGTSHYEDYSTFSRDKRIWKYLSNAWKLLEENSADPQFTNLWNEYSELGINISGWEYDDDMYILSYKQLMEIWKNKKYTSDPRDSLQKRWGNE